MLRFPNPGSDIDSFIRIFQELFESLNTRSSFGLDDISEVLIERNLATSCGYMGQEALERSTRRDRSRDPLYNQSKMYSELFKVLGWMHPLSNSRLNFRFTYFGAHVAAVRRDPKAIFRESVLGIAYPNEILNVRSDSHIRPFSTILRTLDALGGLLARDEMILGPLCIHDDRDEEQFGNMIAEIFSLRGSWRALNDRMEALSSTRNILVDTMRNYTRFPMAVLRWNGWTDSRTDKRIYGRSIKFEHLLSTGRPILDFLNRCEDVRGEDLENIDSVIRDSIVRLGLYQRLERAGFDISSVVDLDLDNERVSRYLCSSDVEILFSPFQELSSESLAQIFPNPTYAENTEQGSLEHLSGINDTPDVLVRTNVDFTLSRMEDHDMDPDIRALFGEASQTSGTMDMIIDCIMKRYTSSNRDQFYPLVTKLFSSIGYDCEISRAGVNYQRWDAIITAPGYSIPIEIKSPGEEQYLSVKAVRQALENKVVLTARNILPAEIEYTSLVVGYNFPNDRSEVSSLINDIFVAYGITIGVMDLRSLLEIAAKQILRGEEHNREQLMRLYGLIELSDA